MCIGYIQIYIRQFLYTRLEHRWILVPLGVLETICFRHGETVYSNQQEKSVSTIRICWAKQKIIKYQVLLRDLHIKLSILQQTSHLTHLLISRVMNKIKTSERVTVEKLSSQPLPEFRGKRIGR